MFAAERILKRTLALSLAGTRGGPVRLEILLLIEKKSRNINDLAKELALDYKTVQHHMRVLHKSGFVIPSGKKYGNSYRLAEIIRINRRLLRAYNMGKSR